jgi:amyloid beta precursor protein binding protein 1
MDTPPKLPPVAPSLPDMHSSTESYVKVQQLYKQAFQEDLQKFSSILAGVLKEIGLPTDAVSETEVESFVKNVGGVAIVKGTSLLTAKEYQGGMKERIGQLPCS